jgi:Asp-tRNA(Asn)/Glu-tRNA(Gln) amidotransferase C subunit
MNEEKIKKQAKKIMDEFISALNKVPKIKEEFGVGRKQFTRKGEKSEYSDEFKKRMLKNAPKVKDEQIQMEKKSW